MTPFDKAALKVGTKVYHKNRGEAEYTWACQALDADMPCPDSIHIELPSGTVIEVTLSLVGTAPWPPKN